MFIYDYRRFGWFFIAIFRPSGINSHGGIYMFYNSNMNDNLINSSFILRQNQAILDLVSSVSPIDTMNKEACIKKLLGLDELPIKHYPKSRYWRIKIPSAIRKEGGIGIPEAIHGKDRDAVVDKLFDLFLHLNITGNCSKSTLTDLFNEFIADRKADPDFAPHTIRKNQCDWNTFFKDTPLVKAPVSTITPADLMAHFKYMTEGRKMTRHAFRNAKGLLNQLFDLAYERNLISSNICRELSTRRLKFKPEACKQDQIYTREERDKIVNDLDGSENVYDKAIIMQFCLGCRVSEVKGLYWSDIDFDNKQIYIHREVVDGENGEQIVKDQTKSGLSEGNRTLPLTERAERVLNSIPKPENKDSLIFHKDYKPLRTQTINSHLLSTCRKLGVRYFSTHKIRAWGITEALASGMDQASIMRIAGHASTQTMRHYVRTARIQKDINENFENVFN